jgi:hypothetical protein
MSLFLGISEVDPSGHTVEDATKAAWEALQAIEHLETSNWTPERRKQLEQLDATSQVNQANTWQVLRMSESYEVFSHYAKDPAAAKIIAMIPELLKEIESIIESEKNRDRSQIQPTTFYDEVGCINAGTLETVLRKLEQKAWQPNLS